MKATLAPVQDGNYPVSYSITCLTVTSSTNGAAGAGRAALSLHSPGPCLTKEFPTALQGSAFLLCWLLLAGGFAGRSEEEIGGEDSWALPTSCDTSSDPKQVPIPCCASVSPSVHLENDRPATRLDVARITSAHFSLLHLSRLPSQRTEGLDLPWIWQWSP